MFNFKESYILFSVSQGPSVPYRFLENRNKQSCPQFSGPRSWDGTHTWIPFRTFYFSVKLLSRVPVSNTWIVFWPCDHCYSLSYCCYASVFSVFYFIFCLKLPCVTIYKHTLPWIKHPFSTRDLGPLRPSFLCLLFLDSCPQVLVCQEDHIKWHLNRDLEYALGKQTEWLWTYWGQ